MATKQNNHHRWIALLIALFVLAGSLFILTLSIWEHGVMVWLGTDSLYYLRMGINIYCDFSFGMMDYIPQSDKVSFQAITHYLPFYPFLHAFVLWLGVSPAYALSVVSFINWFFLLIGMAFLTYRLSASYILAALALTLASLTYGFWWLFQSAMSEVAFLPLLVWVMAVMVDLPAKQTGRWRSLIITTMLLALLMLTRYSGTLVFGAVICWWVWQWWYPKRYAITQFASELGLLSLAAIPFAIWLLNNTLQTRQSPGFHFTESKDTFLDGVLALLQSGTQILIPSLPLSRINNYFELASFVLSFTLLLLILILILLGQYRSVKQSLLAPPRSPILLFLLFYVALYTIIQPFLRFRPVDNRDITSILCLTTPWLFGFIGRHIPKRLAYLFLTALVALNFMLAFGKTFVHGLPEWVSLNPPRFESVADRNLYEDPDFIGHGFISWLLVDSIRTADLVNHHPDLLATVRSYPSDTLILTNSDARQLFAPYLVRGIDRVRSWLGSGACRSRYKVLIVIVGWDTTRHEATELEQRVEAKCPSLTKQTFQHSVIYELPQTRETKETPNGN